MRQVPDSVLALFPTPIRVITWHVPPLHSQVYCKHEIQQLFYVSIKWLRVIVNLKKYAERAGYSLPLFYEQLISVGT